MRRARTIFGAAAALGLAVAWLPLGASSAEAAGVLAGCADPDLPPTDSLTLCQRALRDVRLAPEQRAAVLVNLGVAQAALGRHAEAETSFGLAIQTDPSLITAFANRARSRLALGRFEGALADFDAAIERAPRRPELWLGRGGARLRAGQADAAITDLTRAISIEPELSAAYFNRGVAHLMLGESRAAARDFSTVIARNDRDAGAFLNRGRATATSDRASAERDFDRAVALDPEWGRAWAARGLFFEGLGRDEEARRDFLRAYELGERAPWLLERVGP